MSMFSAPKEYLKTDVVLEFPHSDFYWVASTKPFAICVFHGFKEWIARGFSTNCTEMFIEMFHFLSGLYHPEVVHGSKVYQLS